MQQGQMALGSRVRDGKVVVSVHTVVDGAVGEFLLEVALEPEDAAQFLINLTKALGKVK